MKITINQTCLECPEGTLLLDVLERYGAKPPFAVARNGAFVHRHQYAETRLEEEDVIEVVQPVAGG